MDCLRTKQRFAGLESFLPSGAFEKTIPYFRHYPVQLKVTKGRKTLKGDYRHPTTTDPLHRISINGTLNQYSFLITLLHEIAHLRTFVQYGNKVRPHGKEWKQNFKRVLADFLNQDIFPEDIEVAIKQSLDNLKATTCSDPALDRVLKLHDPRPQGSSFLEDLPNGSHFKLSDGRTFLKIEKLRTRYRCKELSSGRFYYVAALAQVQVVGNRKESAQQPSFR